MRSITRLASQVSSFPFFPLAKCCSNSSKLKLEVKTYGKILRDEEDIKKELTLLSEKVALNLSKQDKAGKIIILKIRYTDFSTLTRRKSLPKATQDASQISQTALQLYEELAEKEKGVRLLGITETGF